MTLGFPCAKCPLVWCYMACVLAPCVVVSFAHFILKYMKFQLSRNSIVYLDFTRRTQRCNPYHYPRTSKILRLAVCIVTVIYHYILPGFSQWENSIQVEVIQTQHQFIHMHIQTLGGDLWVLSMVCGSPNHHMRKSLRHTLNHNTLNPSKLWMTTGDFNVVEKADDTSKRGNLDSRRCTNFTN